MKRDIYKCPYCKKKMSEEELWHHVPYKHGRVTDSDQKNPKLCPICKTDKMRVFAVHLHDAHPPEGHVIPQFSTRPTAQFSLVIVRHPNGKFLLVDEPADWGWWLPAGRVDMGETFAEAAIRETMEEGGIQVQLEGVLGFENTPSRQGGGRQRCIFYATPVDPDEEPKSVPDFESQGAQWFDYEEIRELRLRGSEPVQWTDYLMEGGTIYPLEMFQERKR